MPTLPARPLLTLVVLSLHVWGCSDPAPLTFPDGGRDASLADASACPDMCVDASMDAHIPADAGEGDGDDGGADASTCAEPCGDDCANGISARVAYLKASNSGAHDRFGSSLALSADGSTLAVGAYWEDSDNHGDGWPANDAAPNSGAVYVFRRVGSTWVEEAHLKASNAQAGDAFGVSLALSADGSTLAVGAHEEDSAATGVDADGDSDDAPESGAVYVFQRVGATWTETAYLKPSNTDAGDAFGFSLALSADGSTLAVGAYGESSSATGVGGDEESNEAPRSGAVYVFRRGSSTWGQEAYLKASNTDAGDQFGLVALSADGSTLAVAAYAESSRATGVDGDDENNEAPRSGAVYVFRRGSATWSQEAYLKASNTDALDQLGASIAISADGSTLAVGASQEASSATGVEGIQENNEAPYSGAVYVFRRAGSLWTQEAYIKASNAAHGDQFGAALALSADGSTLAVAATLEDSGARGLDGDQANDDVAASGAVYVFGRSCSTWRQHTYVKASNTDEHDAFGSALALSSDASTLVAGAIGEASAATGVDGDEESNDAPGSGAVYVFR